MHGGGHSQTRVATCTVSRVDSSGYITRHVYAVAADPRHRRHSKEIGLQNPETKINVSAKNCHPLPQTWSSIPRGVSCATIEVHHFFLGFLDLGA